MTMNKRKWEIRKISEGVGQEKLLKALLDLIVWIASFSFYPKRWRLILLKEWVPMKKIRGRR